MACVRMARAPASSAGKAAVAVNSLAHLTAPSTEFANLTPSVCVIRAGVEQDVQHRCVRTGAPGKAHALITAPASVMLDSKATTAQYLPTAANAARGSVGSALADRDTMVIYVKGIVARTAVYTKMEIWMHLYPCALGTDCARISGVSAARASLVATALSQLTAMETQRMQTAAVTARALEDLASAKVKTTAPTIAHATNHTKSSGLVFTAKQTFALDLCCWVVSTNVLGKATVVKR